MSPQDGYDDDGPLPWLFSKLEPYVNWHYGGVAHTRQHRGTRGAEEEHLEMDSLELYSQTRLTCLEALRVVACAGVVAFHFRTALCGFWQSGECNVNREVHDMTDVLFFLVKPWEWVSQGTLDVYIFFTISAFAISSRAHETGDPEHLWRQGFKRVGRLYMPLVCVQVAAAMAFEFGAYDHVGAVGLNWQVLQQEASVARVFGWGLLSPFQPLQLNLAVWTLTYELAAPFYLVVLDGLLSRSRYSTAVILFAMAAGCLEHMGPFAAFTIGYFVAARFYALDGNAGGGRLQATILCFVSMIFTREPILTLVACTVCSGLLTELVANTITVRQALSSPIWSLLAQYTYCIYLVHCPVIYTLGARMLVARSGVALTAVAVCLTTALLSFLLHIFVEAPAMDLNAAIVNALVIRRKRMSGETQHLLRG